MSSDTAPKSRAADSMPSLSRTLRAVVKRKDRAVTPTRSDMRCVSENLPKTHSHRVRGSLRDAASGHCHQFVGL